MGEMFAGTAHQGGALRVGAARARDAGGRMGGRFLRAGWRSVTNRSPNMFTLIALGTGAAYVHSLVATIAPNVLSSGVSRPRRPRPRVLRSGSGDHGARAPRPGARAACPRETSRALRALVGLARRRRAGIEPGGDREVALDAVVLGDRLRVRPGERVPVDGVVEEGTTTIDESMLTESRCRSRSVPAIASPGR
jgi:Cu+-exporting ATPase